MSEVRIRRTEKYFEIRISKSVLRNRRRHLSPLRQVKSSAVFIFFCFLFARSLARSLIHGIHSPSFEVQSLRGTAAAGQHAQADHDVKTTECSTGQHSVATTTTTTTTEFAWQPVWHQQQQHNTLHSAATTELAPRHRRAEKCIHFEKRQHQQPSSGKVHNCL